MTNFSISIELLDYKMEIAAYKNIFQNEEDHFFYKANHEIVLSLVRHYLTAQSAMVLDAGCGTGLMAAKLGRFGRVWGIDISPEAVKFAKKRGVKVRKASVLKIPFRANTFDLITSLDVIYHKQVDDIVALREFYRVLKPNGILILRVPANKWLKLNHDKEVHTRERYIPGELKRKLLNAGFQIRLLSFVNMVLLPLAILKQLQESFEPKKIESGVGKVHPLINRVLLALLLIEVTLLRYVNLPFGLGIISVCRKTL